MPDDFSYVRNETKKELYRKSIEDATDKAIVDLNLIINTANPTNAQVVQAVKTIAKIMLKTIYFFIKEK